MANAVGIGREGSGDTQYSAYNYQIDFIVETEDGEIDLSRELVSLEISLSTVDIIPQVIAKFTVATTLLPRLVDKMWTATVNVYHKRGIDSKVPDKYLMNLKLISPTILQNFPVQPSKALQNANIDYTILEVSLIEKKTTQLFRTYVDGIYDFELLKEDNTLEYVVCDLFKQANKGGLEFVFHKPKTQRPFEQISVPRTWFLNAFLNLHQSYGIYDTIPLIYSDGFTFYIVNIKNRATVNVSDLADCSVPDDPERNTYDKVNPSFVDKAVLIHPNTTETPREAMEDNVDKAVYRIYTPITAVGNNENFKTLIPNKINHVIEQEKYLYEREETKILDLVNIDMLFSAGTNHITNEIFKLTDDLRTTTNRVEGLNFYKSLIQQALFNVLTFKIKIPPPLRLEHFAPGFTYRFLPLSENYKQLDGRYLSTAVVYRFNRTGIAWQSDITLFLTTAMIQE